MLSPRLRVVRQQASKCTSTSGYTHNPCDQKEFPSKKGFPTNRSYSWLLDDLIESLEVSVVMSHVSDTVWVHEVCWEDWWDCVVGGY